MGIMFITITVEAHKEQFGYGDPMGRTELTLNIEDNCSDLNIGSCVHTMLQSAIRQYQINDLNMATDTAKEEQA